MINIYSEIKYQNGTMHTFSMNLLKLSLNLLNLCYNYLSNINIKMANKNK